MSLVSIIVPAFNAARFIRRALESVSAQTYNDWELIVVDDGSTDDTGRVVRDFARVPAQNVHYESNGTTLGVSQTRNRALSLARGEIIAFLDADDWWTEQHLQVGVTTLSQGFDLCYSSCHIYDELTQAVTGALIPSREELSNPLTSLFKHNFINTSSLVMVTIGTIRKVGGFDASLSVGEDVDYWIRALNVGCSLKYTGAISCYYAKHSASAMAKTLLVSEQAIKFYRKHSSNQSLPQNLRLELLANSLFQYGRLVRRTDPVLARSLFQEACRTYPAEWRYWLFCVATLLLPHKRNTLQQ